MACNSNVEGEPWITLFWNIENYSYWWQIIDTEFQTPVMQLKDSIKLRAFVVTETEQTKNIFLCIERECNDKSESIEVETDFALLAENGSVLHMKPRHKTTTVQGASCIIERLLKLDDRMTIKIKSFLSPDTMRIRCRFWRTDMDTVAPVNFFARTAMSVRKVNFLWDIERFSFLKSGEKVDFVLRSESEDDEATFSLRVNEADRILISIASVKEDARFLIIQSFITDTNGCKIDCGRCEILPDEIKNAICMLPFTKKYLMDNENVYLKNDVLSLYIEYSSCEGFDLNRIEKISFGSNQDQKKTCISHFGVEETDKWDDLKEDFENLHAEGFLSDVQLRTASQTFNAHKNILSARSPVFRAMFRMDMKEKMQECVPVPDLEADTVRRMLLYMYTNALKGLHWESATKLYAAADKYQVVALKSKCSSFLISNLCPSNLCEVLVLADMHADDNFKRVAQEYALLHEVDIFSSDEWNEFAKNNCRLAAETMLRKWNNKNIEGRKSP